MLNKQLFQSLAVAAFAFELSAQEYRGRVQGSVTDGSQAAVSGATVTLGNVETGVASTRQTGEQGRYLFDLVLPGKYTVTVQLQGFNKFVQANVVLQSRSDVTVDAVLRPGDVRETVTVEAQASTVQFNTSKLETTVDSALVSNLPRSVDALGVWRRYNGRAYLENRKERLDQLSPENRRKLLHLVQGDIAGDLVVSHDIPLGIGNSPPATKLAVSPEIAVRFGSANVRSTPARSIARSVALMFFQPPMNSVLLSGWPTAENGF